MYLIRVTDHDLAKEFIHLPARLSHLQKGASKVRQKHIKALITRKSTFFEHGKAEFWILTNFRGQTIGRIAAFIEHPDQPEKAKGYIGLFDCIHHFKAASLLFDECKEWFRRFGLKSMRAPVSLLPFQLEGIASGSGFQQATPFFSAQADNVAELYEFYGFKVYNTQQLLSFDAISSLLAEENQAKAKILLADQSYSFSRVVKSEVKTKAVDIQMVYKAVYHENFPVPSTEDIIQWLNLLFEQHYHPLIWIVYHKQLPIAFFVNTYISASQQVSQNASVWQQLFSRLSAQNKSLLCLGLFVHPDFQTLNIPVALLSVLEEALVREPSSTYESFLIMNDNLHSFQVSGEAIDTFVKLEYQFDQEGLVDTFTRSNIIPCE